MPDSKIRVLFICMGNICRSPAAEAVFLRLIADRGIAATFHVDSAGTGGWHAGEPADHRSRGEGARRGYDLSTAARQVHDGDWEAFDLLVCMDRDNASLLLDRGAPEKKVRLLLDWHPDPAHAEVPDPYYGGEDGFVHMYDLIEAACGRLVDELEADGPKA
ncbi:MAG: phosphotyrosine protein phosphatase [Phycisphaerae bacterium]|nr:phosphotyrosine protein phosphatase [Phycisphaerae bacterium]